MSRAARRFAAVAETIATNHPVDPVAEKLEARLRLVDQLVDRLELANQPAQPPQPVAQPVQPVVDRWSAYDVLLGALYDQPDDRWSAVVALVGSTFQWSVVAGAAGWQWVPLPLAALILLSLVPAHGRGSQPVQPTTHGRRA
jgi:hypothetical protein